MGPGASEALPDSLRPGLDIVFVGTAAGRRSAAQRAYYAHPGNRFWRTLHEVGLTQRQYQPAEFGLLLDLGLGFTDLAKHHAGMDRDITPQSYDCAELARKLEALRPRAIAFTSKKASSIWFGRPSHTLRTGLQAGRLIGASLVFALPSPSGAASRFWSVEPWRDLAAMYHATSHDI